MELDLVESKEKKNNSRKTGVFRLAGKNLFLTYPRCELERKDLGELLLSKVGVDYMIVCRELHEDGFPHLHVLMTLKKKFETRSPTYFDVAGYHGNYQTARVSDDVREYITKYDTHPWEHGVYSGNNPSKVQKRAIENKLLLSKPLNELVDEGVVHLSQYKQYKEAIQSYKLDSIHVPEYMPKKAIWIFGATGIGKSRYVRDNFPGQAYFKPQNKWWDGYSGQSVVLIDDFDHHGACLGHYLKIWGDCYSFCAEVKGGTLRPVYDHLFITSQYLPRDIWCPGTDESKWDQEMRAAIERRFKIMTIEDGQLVEYYN
jgi:alkylated DNA nucleotide flippase Atl1